MDANLKGLRNGDTGSRTASIWTPADYHSVNSQLQTSAPVGQTSSPSTALTTATAEKTNKPQTFGKGTEQEHRPEDSRTPPPHTTIPFFPLNCLQPPETAELTRGELG